MKNTSKALLILGLTTVLAACQPKQPVTPSASESDSEDIPGNVVTASQDYNDYGLRGKKYRGSYNVLTTVSIASLNYLTTQEQANAQHFANFIDGLLLHNDFGVLEKNLATEVKHDEEYTKFQIKVKEGVKWQRSDGSQYINSANEPQFVKAQDWVTTAKTICTYANKSDLEYLVGNFVKGATEYYYYTRITYDISQGTDRTDINNHQKVAEKINSYIKKEAPQVWELEYNNGDNPVTKDDVPNIVNLSRFGVKADGNTLTYTLNQPAPYFPTLFTYSAYMPVNEDFLTATKFSKFGTTAETILYCGPYLLKTWSPMAIKYKANPEYHNKENTITIDEINYTVIQDTSIITPEYTRTEFEAGRIDGFSLNRKDGIGWGKYITGPDGTGTYDNPYDPQVNARLLDQIGSMYGSNIVLDRDNTGALTSHATGGTTATIKNAARAFRLNDVRKLLLDGPDYKQLYDVRYESTEEELRAQEKVYTYVPKGFVMDDDGKDYLESYYEVYGQKKGMPAGDIDNPQPGTAAYVLRPGQLDTCTLTQEEVNVLVDNALNAINLYNTTVATKEADKITLPIQIEYYSTYFDADTKEADDKVIASLNKRFNKGAEGSYPYFKVIPTDLLTSNDYNTVSRNGEWDLAYIQWGWGADYGDPLSFMNTYCKYGDWGDVFPYIDQAEVKNYVTNATGTALEEPVDLLAEYTSLVKEGAQQTSDFNARFAKFAEAEYMLINELNIYRPQVNTGQGWAMSVSKAAGYYSPQANYGLSNDRFTGMFVLEEVMTRDERQAARDKQTTLKEAYVKAHGSVNIYTEDDELID